MSAVLSIALLIDLQLQRIDRRLTGGQELSWDGVIGVQPGTLLCVPSYMCDQLVSPAADSRLLAQAFRSMSDCVVTGVPMAVRATSARGV